MSCRVRTRRIGPNAYVGSLTIGIPDSPGYVQVAGIGSSLSSALRKAASIAAHVANDPVMSSLLPPQARAGIEAARVLAKAAERGKPALRAAMAGYSGPGKARLAKALAKAAPARRRRRRRVVVRRPMPAPAPVAPVETPLEVEAELDVRPPDSPDAGQSYEPTDNGGAYDDADDIDGEW